MPKPTTYSTQGWSLTDTPFLGHIQVNGLDISQSGISAAAYTVIYSDGTVEANEVALTVANVVFNTLQTGPEWTADNAGYNLAVIIPGASFPQAGDYVVRIDLTPNGGSKFPAIKAFHHAKSLQ